MTKTPSRGRSAGLPASRREARAARLAAALKANLQRRKLQARSRAVDPDTTAAADGAGASERPREPDQLGKGEAAPLIGAAIVEDKRTG
jgi:hypothetical protein